MKDIVLSARRGIDCLVDLDVLKSLFVSALIWTAVTKLFGWLLLGPALVVLFRIAIKALRGEETDLVRDNLAVLEDLPVSLVAGILFALPFTLWGFLDDVAASARSLRDVAVAQDPSLAMELLRSPGVPWAAGVALFIHFGLHVFIFPTLAERHCGLIEATRRAHELADPALGRQRAMGRHFLFTSVVLVVMLVVGAWAWLTSWVFTTLLGPVAVVMLASWYLHVTGSPAAPTVEAGQREIEDVL